MATKVNELRPGMAINMDGKLLVVVSTDHVKPGKGPAYIQAKMKDIKGAGVLERRFNSSDTVEQINVDRRQMEFLFSDPSGATFMDLETYDQAIIDADILGDALLYLKPNTEITALCYEGNPITIELPATVDLQITDTTPQVKGATQTNQLKEAECETGLKTRVPPFIETGELIRISTKDGSYQSRAKGE